MPRTYSESFSILQSAMRDVEEAQAYYDRAEGQEQIDEASIRLTAAITTVDRIIREMKRERGLKMRKYECKFEHIPNKESKGV